MHAKNIFQLAINKLLITIYLFEYIHFTSASIESYNVLESKNHIPKETADCYSTLLVEEWLKIRRMLKNNSKFFELNNKTREIIFYKKNIELNEKLDSIKKSQKKSNQKKYNLSWYNNYEPEDIDIISEKLSNNSFNINIEKSLKTLNFVFKDSIFNNNEINTDNKSNQVIINKILVILIFYKTFTNDAISYEETIRDSEMLNFLNEFDEIIENDDTNYLKVINLLKNKEKIDFQKCFPIQNLISWLWEFLNYLIDLIKKIVNIIDNTRKKLYASVLNYYLWSTIITKIILFLSRKFVSFYSIFDKVIIYFIDLIEDYVFMFISLQFTYELIITVIFELC